MHKLILFGLLLLYLTVAKDVYANKVNEVVNSSVVESLSIEPNVSYWQTFISPSGEVGVVDVYIGEIDNSACHRLEFRLTDSTGEMLAGPVILETTYIRGNAFLPVGFAQQVYESNSMGIEMISWSHDGTSCMSLGVNDTYADGALFVDGKAIEADMVFRVGRDVPVGRYIRTNLTDEIRTKVVEQRLFWASYLIGIISLGVILLMQNKDRSGRE